ncbi:hypothetical protein SASPL_147203 [Salvia splendens]|uniref:Auxin-responsive protein n=1 Tax=Salvia splendens TaxID=180675 RepID=A0A8X8WER3_SALSN|nr:auxin-responsive protein IAA17-like [Salvia splendens]KAG6392973.1 hypothetical protein SASPL_147203 [Salvia splendens]
MVDAVMVTKKLSFDETELRLGLPNAGDKKRGFDETVDLKLNLNIPSDQTDFQGNNVNHDAKTNSPKPPGKSQVVGWPPVRSYWKNVMAVQKRSEVGESGGALVKEVLYLKECQSSVPNNQYREAKPAKEFPFSFDPV